MVDKLLVLIVDDHPLFRDALETALERAFPDRAQVVHAGSLQAALGCLAMSTPHLILLDLNLGDASGFEGLSRLRAAAPDVPVYVVSATETPSAYGRARALGAGGYLPKSLPLADLSAALATALDGGEWFPESRDSAGKHDGAERVASLTPAQRRVLAGLSDGLLNKQIAFEMGISEATVKAHMTAIFRKLGANNRTQALLIFQSANSLDADHSAA